MLAILSAALLGGLATAQENATYPGDASLYLYRAELQQVVDAGTVSLDMDLGFHVWLHKTKIRLAGIEAPASGTEEARQAMVWLTEKLRDATELGELRIKSFPAPRGSDIPWIGILFAEGKNLNEAMVAAGLAKAAPR